MLILIKSELDNPESMFIYPSWYQIKQLYYEEIIWYATIANDLCVCRNVFIDFYKRKISCLDKYDKEELIRAWNDDHICGIGLFARQLRSSGLGLAPDVMRDTSLGFFPTVSVEMTYKTKPTTDGKVDMVRSYTFERLSHYRKQRQ